jgi:hypothetical protein
VSPNDASGTARTRAITIGTAVSPSSSAAASPARLPPAKIAIVRNAAIANTNSSALSAAPRPGCAIVRGVRSSSGLAIGIAIGALLGATAMYLALERPWRGGAAVAAVDAGVPDVGGPAVAKKKARKKKRGGGGGTRVEADPTAPPLSAADQKLSWKGESMDRPATTIDLGEDGDEARALSASEIQATIDRDGGGLERCVEDGLGGAVWSGEVTVQLLVDGNGRATKTRVRAPAFMHGHDVLGCARSAGKHLDFPATGGYTVVTVPIPIEF